MKFAYIKFIDQVGSNGLSKTPEGIHHPAVAGKDSYLEILYPTDRPIEKAQQEISTLAADYVIAFGYGKKMHELWSRKVLKVPFIQTKKKMEDYIETLRTLPESEFDSLRKLNRVGFFSEYGDKTRGTQPSLLGFADKLEPCPHCGSKSLDEIDPASLFCGECGMNTTIKPRGGHNEY